jgi:site-specific DNA-methyltransferase (adenine-specific)
LLTASGTLYLHLDYREAHYVKLLLDELFGRECFLNEIVWAYDYGAKPRRRWPAKHDTILVYVKDPDEYWFDSEAVDREPYMAPGLVTAEKAARGKLPTDVWWHTIVSPTGGRRRATPRRSPRACSGGSCRPRAAPGTGASTRSPGAGPLARSRRSSGALRPRRLEPGRGASRAAVCPFGRRGGG